MPVFLAAVSTILGAIMFLRFGYAVGQQGLLGALGVIVLGHLVTIPTALAVSEISTNLKVEGGGEYFFVSRSFGPRMGAAVGVSLYISQAISVAFYLIAFAEAFRPLAPALADWGIAFDPRMVSLPATVLLVGVILTRGANLGVRLLYPVVAILAAALAAFFLGDPVDGYDALPLAARVDDPDRFFLVFAICFPAFTGMTAGVGLSGDLANPRRSIPLGTLAATITGLVVYTLIAIKLAASAPPEVLAGDELVMARIAVWGPMILIGLGCATLSSAIGSLLVAPRTLQALGRDGALPSTRLNASFARGRGSANEPRTATLFTGAIALVIVGFGDVDFVARLISMFFMVTYGALCAISFLEHFAANPSYRPTFRSRWSLSLFGAAMCFLTMFQMDPVYAVLAIAAMAGFYALTQFTPAGRGERDLADLFLGVMGQATRWMRIRLHRARRSSARGWRPSIITVADGEVDERRDSLQLLAWLCARYGFATFLHHIPGRLDSASYRASVEDTESLLTATRRYPGVFVDAVVSPSRRSALAQCLQLPGVTGLQNNTALFELRPHDAQTTTETVDDVRFAAATEKNLLVLRCGPQGFGDRRLIDVWTTWHDGDNATLMLLIGYMFLDHADWRGAEIRVFAAFPDGEVEEQQRRFETLVEEGRLPISRHNIRFHRVNDGEAFGRLVEDRSAQADLVIMGFTLDRLRHKGVELLLRHAKLHQVLYVCARDRVLLT